MQCRYEQEGKRCSREAISDRGLCLFHEDHKSEGETLEEFYKEIDEGITDFDGCILPGFVLSNREIEGCISFDEAKINGSVRFENINLKGSVFLKEAKIEGNVVFRGKIEEGDGRLDGATIKGNIVFVGELKGNIYLNKARVEGNALFQNAIIKEKLDLYRAIIEGDALFNEAKIGNIRFNRATVIGKCHFEGATIDGEVSFNLTNIGDIRFMNERGKERAMFRKPEAQEEACRTARIIQDKIGNRRLADYHYYREMEASRKQKHPIIRFFLEPPIQYVFGYGTYWYGILIAWFLVVFSFSFIFWLFNGVEGANSSWDCIYFSIATATTLGYGDLHPNTATIDLLLNIPIFRINLLFNIPIFRILAGIEAIIGTFMWAAFIAIFARKYMR